MSVHPYGTLCKSLTQCNLSQDDIKCAIAIIDSDSEGLSALSDSLRYAPVLVLPHAS